MHSVGPASSPNERIRGAFNLVILYVGKITGCSEAVPSAIHRTVRPNRHNHCEYIQEYGRASREPASWRHQRPISPSRLPSSPVSPVPDDSRTQPPSAATHSLPAGSASLRVLPVEGARVVPGRRDCLSPPRIDTT